MALKDATGEVGADACAYLMLTLYQSDDRQAFLSDVLSSRKKSRGKLIEEQYEKYSQRLSEPLTPRLWYEPQSWNPWKMVTATVSHGSWWHLIGNLYFFFAFAVAVELIVGWWRYLVTIAVIGIATGVAYSLSSLGADDPLPTVGLSGVVMAMMALFTYFLPTGGIRCLLWIVVLFKRLTIPAWILFVWYFGWDVYAVQSGGKPGVNLIAHVSGGVIGLPMGALFFQNSAGTCRCSRYRHLTGFEVDVRSHRRRTVGLSNAAQPGDAGNTISCAKLDGSTHYLCIKTILTPVSPDRSRFR